MGQTVPQSSFSARPPRALLVCSLLLIVFALIAWLAARTKSPTYDEPYHAASAWTVLHRGDFRLDCEDPPLWKYWAALPNRRDALSADFTGQGWSLIPNEMARQWYWCVTTLYRTPGNDAEGFMRRSRAMMLMIGVALGALTGWWAWHIAGAVAAIVAVGLFALDPNFLAHAPLVKNDVAFSLAMLAMCFALWRAGQRLTGWRLIVLALSCAVMLSVKFSGVLAAVLVPLMLGIRAMMPTSWRALGRERVSRRSRLLAAMGASAVCAAAALLGVWAVYGFRFDPTPVPGLQLNTSELARMAADKEALVAGRSPEPGAAPGGFVDALRFAEDRRLLPQAWIAGLIFTYQSALVRESFLGGQTSSTGFWYYFPFAMLVKTPVATLVMAGLAAVVMLLALGRMVSRTFTATLGVGRGWTIACLVAPAVIYMTIAMRGNLNIGLRHVLPVYPLAFILVGWAADAALRRWGRRSAVVLLILGAALAVETLSAYPDFIPFFNTLAGGKTAGLKLLGDSNLDWGQDLKLLRDWQQRHPERPMYLSYFGLADPRYYGVRYTPLPGGYHFDGKPSWPSGVCVVAVSATYLQGLLVDPELYDQFYKRIAAMTPTEVLGGTIYLYELPVMSWR